MKMYLSKKTGQLSKIKDFELLNGSKKLSKAQEKMLGLKVVSVSKSKEGKTYENSK